MKDRGTIPIVIHHHRVEEEQEDRENENHPQFHRSCAFDCLWVLQSNYFLESFRLINNYRLIPRQALSSGQLVPSRERIPATLVAWSAPQPVERDTLGHVASITSGRDQDLRLKDFQWRSESRGREMKTVPSTGR